MFTQRLIKKILYAVFTLIFGALFCSCGNGGTDESVFFLGGNLTLTLYDGDAAAAKAEIRDFLRDFESDISVNIKSSQISKFNSSNEGAETALSEDVYAVLERAKSFYADSGKAFNPCLYDLSLLWGFYPDSPGLSALPAEEDIQALLSHANPDNIMLNGANKTASKVQGAGGVKIDLGGIAKGYAVGKCRDIAVKHGVTSGIINIAGNVYAIGKHKAENRAFKIGITDPRAVQNSNPFFAKFMVENTSVSTSGDYERFYILDGKRYCHIISPFNGYPVDNGVISVAAVGENAMDTDAFTTAAMALGAEKGVELFNKYGVKGIIITQGNGNFYYYVCGDVPFEAGSVHSKYTQALING